METRDNYCDLHGLSLIQGEATIIYGIWEPTEEYVSARERLFPRSRLRVPGGCVVGDEDTERTLGCPACREAELQWKPFSETF